MLQLLLKEKEEDVAKNLQAVNREQVSNAEATSSNLLSEILPEPCMNTAPNTHNRTIYSAWHEYESAW